MSPATLYNVLAAGASCGILIVCSELLKPTPLLHVRYRDVTPTRATVDVQISQGSFASLENLTHVHGGLDCLKQKGYHVISSSKEKQTVLRLEGPAGYGAFRSACDQCEARTAIVCDGTNPRTVPWNRVLR